ncbi:MAG: MIP/aquaporin family protein [Candidatus Limnocylindria bacterium]
MDNFLAELIGTAILVTLGNGVVAGVLLARSKAENAGWIVIAAGWGLALGLGVYAVAGISGAHLNPAITLGQVLIGELELGDASMYVAGQFAGAFIGAILVWLHYLPHWGATEDPALKLAAFSTGPAIRNSWTNLTAEAIGTFFLAFGISAILQSGNEVGALGGLLIGALLFAIGLSLGGPTGFAVNPARDLGPRIAHALLPISGKGTSDWGYAWIPVVGPLVGGAVGALAFQLLFTNGLLGR